MAGPYDNYEAVQNGCLLIHGLTGTPATVASLRESLLSAGFLVSAPCLAGHGGDTVDLARSCWRDWYDTARAAFSTLRRETERVFCAGASLGALLCIKLALDEGWGVRAMALMGTPLRFSIFQRIATPVVRYSPLRAIIKQVPKDFEKSVADPDGRVQYEQLSLSEIPSKSIFEICDLQRILLSSLHRLSNPILLMHGRGDRVAPLSNISIIKKNVASDIVESVIFERSNHVISMDAERDGVAKTAVDFFRRFS